jgi:NAD(P)-dependent dehydrogenase (short-subunit alcohol dehydrogenase family)
VKKTILIAPFNGPVAAAVASEARGAGWKLAIALARAPRRETQEQVEETDGDSFTLSYNPASFVSVSAMVHAANNALGEIDAAVLIADPTRFRADFTAGSPGELGALVEEQCAGPLYLVRELVRRFEARKAGRILLLAPERPRDAALGPVASLAAGAFEGLGGGLFTMAEGAPWTAYGVLEASGIPERAARFVLALLEEQKASKAGRWIRHTGKTGIFGAS